jgi:hypothetical protein
MGKHDFEAPSSWKGVREVSGTSFDTYEPEERQLVISRRLILLVMYMQYAVRTIRMVWMLRLWFSVPQTLER